MFLSSHVFFTFFFFNDTATTEIYTLSLHDALPISPCCLRFFKSSSPEIPGVVIPYGSSISSISFSLKIPSSRINFLTDSRSEEHTSELQSRQYLVCRLLLEKKKKNSYQLCVNIDIL